MNVFRGFFKLKFYIFFNNFNQFMRFHIQRKYNLK